jgi:hypothetical protein
MPTYHLQIKAELEGIQQLQPISGHLWKMDVEGEGNTRNGITVSESDVIELEGSKGEANYVMKWDKSSKHQAYIKIVPSKGCDFTYKAEDSGKWVTILAIEVIFFCIVIVINP